jgi:hypothetical protein
MNGVALAAFTREHWPFVEIAVTSGKAKPSAAALPERTHFFSKPYNTRLVVDHVREATHDAAGGSRLLVGEDSGVIAGGGC